MDLRLDGSFLVEGDSVYGQNPASTQQSVRDKLPLIASQAVRYQTLSSFKTSTKFSGMEKCRAGSISKLSHVNLLCDRLNSLTNDFVSQDLLVKCMKVFYQLLVLPSSRVASGKRI